MTETFNFETGDLSELDISEGNLAVSYNYAIAGQYGLRADIDATGSENGEIDVAYPTASNFNASLLVRFSDVTIPEGEFISFFAFRPNGGGATPLGITEEVILDTMLSQPGYSWNPWMGIGDISAVAINNTDNIIDIQNIPQTYDHIRVKIVWESHNSNGTSASNYTDLFLNNDTTLANYVSTRHGYYNNILNVSRAATASVFFPQQHISQIEFRINNYSTTVIEGNNRQIYYYGQNQGWHNDWMINNFGSIVVWKNPQAVNRITLKDRAASGGWRPHPRITIFGIKDV